MVTYRYIEPDGSVDVWHVVNGHKRCTRVQSGSTFECERWDHAANSPRLFNVATTAPTPTGPDTFIQAQDGWEALRSHSFADAKAQFEATTDTPTGRGWGGLHKAFVTWSGFDVPLTPAEEEVDP